MKKGKKYILTEDEIYFIKVKIEASNSYLRDGKVITAFLLTQDAIDKLYHIIERKRIK